MSDEDPPSGGEDPTPDGRLDPLRKARTDRPKPPPRPSQAVIDTRRYRRMIGAVGLTIVVVLSAYLFISHGVSTPGVAAGGRLHKFVAPLAGSGINKAANADPICDPKEPTAKALNVCGRTPLVLDFFVTGSGSCVKEVNTLQTVSRQFPGIQFAALAVRGSLKKTESLVRQHHWTIPVAVDPDGRVGEIYGVDLCPIVEVVRPGGRVARRLIGNDWQQPARLASAVRVLTKPAPPVKPRGQGH